MWRPILSIVIVLMLVACSPEPNPSETPTSDATPEGSSQEASDAIPGAETPLAASEAPKAAVSRPVVVFLGNSLTAGFGLDEAQAFPALIGARLRETGHDVRVVNAGLSGDTTAGGLRRLDWLLRQEPDVVMVALGGNDGLRALALEATETNLRTIIETSQAAGARVILGGMLIPPNYGPAYTDSFAAIYPRLAEEYDLEYIPFLLEGVAADPELNLPDGIHPNIEGQKKVAELVYPYVLEALGYAATE